MQHQHCGERIQVWIAGGGYRSGAGSGSLSTWAGGGTQFFARVAEDDPLASIPQLHAVTAWADGDAHRVNGGRDCTGPPGAGWISRFDCEIGAGQSGTLRYGGVRDRSVGGI